MGNKDLDLHHQQKRQQSPAFCSLGYCSSKLNFNFDLNREDLKISSTPIRKKKNLELWLPTSLVSVLNTEVGRKGHYLFKTCNLLHQCFPHTEASSTYHPVSIKAAKVYCVICKVEPQSFYVHSSSLQQPRSHMKGQNSQRNPCRNYWNQLSYFTKTLQVQIQT